MAEEKTIKDVESFWDANPLFVGESRYEPGSKEFFEEHREVYIKDCFAGKMDPRIFPADEQKTEVLDLGCGPGFWVIELAHHGAKHLNAADLSQQAITLAGKRASIYGVDVSMSKQNAEALDYRDREFTHVNCQGVIHHTLDTQSCVREIARVLRPGGTALISVYYQNVFLRHWKVLKYVARLAGKLGAGLKGRGREEIYTANTVDDIVKLYDGADNPIGKAYTKKEFLGLLQPYFEVDELFLHFFPARSLPFCIPNWLHALLDRYFGFLIYAKCSVKESDPS